jgi:hypothetical protein
MRLYIDVKITEADGFLWRLIGFYGEPSTEKRFCLGRRCVLSVQRDDDHGFVLGTLTRLFRSVKKMGASKGTGVRGSV